MFRQQPFEAGWLLQSGFDATAHGANMAQTILWFGRRSLGLKQPWVEICERSQRIYLSLPHPKVDKNSPNSRVQSRSWTDLGRVLVKMASDLANTLFFKDAPSGCP